MKRAALVAVAALAACDQTAIVGETPDGGAAGQTWVQVNLGTRTHDIDVLFVVDNSPSMSPKQNELKTRFAQLAAMFDAFGAQGHPGHYHIGVVTTDLGAGPFTLGAGQCRPGGDRGQLIATGAAASPSCIAPVGAPFIDLDQIAGTDNLPVGQSLSATFSCMASVGDKGCGFEMPLESAYQALQPGQNAGFLRPDSALAVAFVTDEDDCSAPADGDLFDPSRVADYGALLSYRCTQFGVTCNGDAPPYGPSNGALGNCAPAPAGKLYGAERYIDFFTRPGGARSNPGDVLLFAIDAPAQPFEVILANPVPMPPGPYSPCPGPVDGTRCAVVLNHSCVSTTNSQFFGDPAVRLNTVVSRSPVVGSVTSICSTSYGDAMDRLGHALVSFQSGFGCLPAAPPDTNDPRCEVRDETLEPDGTTTVTPIPGCLDQPDATCWRVDSSPFCTGYDPTGAPTVHLQLTVQRSGAPPPNTLTRARCVVVTG